MTILDIVSQTIARCAKRSALNAGLLELARQAAEAGVPRDTFAGWLEEAREAHAAALGHRQDPIEARRARSLRDATRRDRVR